MLRVFLPGFAIMTSWLGVLLALLPSAAGAQVPRQLQYVKRLRPVPPPPGGLIPYRKGNLWGYADTTGRIVCIPSLSEMPPCISEPVQARYPEAPPGGSATTLRGRPYLPSSYFRKSPQAEWFINGNGEILTFDYRTHAAILQPDGSLRVRRRRRSAGQREVLYWGSAANGTFQRLTRPVAEGRGWVVLTPLGAGRWASREINPEKSRLDIGNIHSPNLVDRTYYRPDGYCALLDTSGQQLTPYQYGVIGPFRQGRAVFWRAGLYGYLDRAGREVVPPLYNAAQSFSRGWARVGNAQHSGFVDTLGHFWPAVRVPDEAQLLRQPASGGGVRFVRPDGQPAFAGQFAEAAGFTNGRAWVRCGKQQGLIDEQGRWIAPCQYDDLRFALPGKPPPLVHDWNSSQPAAYGVPVPEHGNDGSGQQAGVDTAYMQFRRAGKLGFLRRRSGQEVIAARYDSVRVPLLQNVATLWRGGVSYVVTGQGQELGAGILEHVYRLSGQRYFQLSQADSWIMVDSTQQVHLAGSARLPAFRGPLPGRLAAVATTSQCGVASSTTQYSGPQTCAGAVDWAGHWVIPAHYAALRAEGPFLFANRISKTTATPCNDNSQQERVTVFDSTGRQLTTRQYWDVRYLPGTGLLGAHSQGRCVPADTLVLLNIRGREMLRLPGTFAVAAAAPTVAPALRRRFVRLWSFDKLPPGRSNTEGLGYLGLNGRRFWAD